VNGSDWPIADHHRVLVGPSHIAVDAGRQRRSIDAHDALVCHAGVQPLIVLGINARLRMFCEVVTGVQVEPPFCD
jgi:hypothetical protein